jgi:17beta-estradiol 17-dehydrogenase / very-long-chain 3-oxoacyl-CoA reductase
MSSKDVFANVPPGFQWLFMIIGALYLTSKAIGFVRFFAAVFLLGGTNVRLPSLLSTSSPCLANHGNQQLRKYGKPGTWAVVTGASDGLGKEFALQLASKGFNLVLVSRTRSKLDNLVKDLGQKYPGKGIQTKIVVMDYSQNRDEDYTNLAEALYGLDVGILVNNVGQSHSIPVTFMDTPPKELQEIVMINCLGTLRTTKVVLPLMEKRRRGLILTIGSFAGWLPTPYLATYSGSKAFLQYWSSSLAAEVKPHGIDVELVLSYLVTTALSKVRRTSLLIPSPRDFVKSALAKVGCGGSQNASNTYTPWWSHGMMIGALESTLGIWNSWAIWYNMLMHKDIRRRALRKAEREAKKA